MKTKNKIKNKQRKQNKRINYYEGAISVYLCLMLTVVISIVLVLIEGARLSAMRVQLECASDMAIDSCLAEYHKELFDRYGVFFIDSSYRDRYGRDYGLSDRIDYYMTYNLSPDKGLLPAYGSRDLLGLGNDSVEMLKLSRATDNKGEVFKYMAVSYMLDRFGIGYIDDLKNMTQVSDSNHLFEGNILEENDEASNSIDSIEYPDDEDIDWDEVDKSNPADNVNALRSKGVLPLVCKEEISEKSINKNEYASSRNLVKGNGLNRQWDERNSLETELLFIEYILLKCGNHNNVLDNSVLDYQVEYIIAGHNNDTDNLKDIAVRLLLIRGASNTAYFFSDNTLKLEAKALASGLSIILLIPELEILFEAAIIAAWIFAESLYDVKIIFSGGRVPLIKTAGDWNLCLSNALELTEDQLDTVSASGNDKGMSYEDYLRLLLYMTDKDERTMRCLDIVEMDIRNITDDDTFKLDDCIASFEMQVISSSSYGYSFLFNRSGSYW